MAHVLEQTFTSPESMAQTAGRLTALPWPNWSARVRSLDVDGVRADYVELDPYELELPPLQDRTDRSTRLMLSIMLTGTSTGSIDDHPVQLSSKQAALIDGRAAFRFRATAPVRAVRMFVEEDHLPADALQSPDLPFALLKHTPLVTGCVGLISGLLQVGSASIERHDEFAVSRPLIALMNGLLDEALLERDSTTSADLMLAAPLERQRRIEEYIDRHLAERTLHPATIARAFGVHVRTIHTAYEQHPQTVAARIRDLRIVRIKALLARRDEPPVMATLAPRVGLTPSQLTRLFRAATGQTARQWWHEHREAPASIPRPRS